MTRARRAILYGLAAVLLWSTVATAFKLSLRHLRPLPLLLFSSTVSTLALLALLAVRRQLGQLARFSGRDWLRSAVYGLINPFAYYAVLFAAYDRLPAQEAQPLNYTWAITLALLSVPLLGQRLRLRTLAALLVSYGGVVVIATRGDLTGLRFADPLGVGLALGSTLLWALYWILNTRDTREPVAALAGNFLCGTVYILGATALSGGLALPPAAGLAGALWVGCFEMGLTFVLWGAALKLTDSAARVSNLIFLSPFLSLVLIHVVLGEAIRPSTGVGLVLIVGGLLIQGWGGQGDAGEAPSRSEVSP